MGMSLKINTPKVKVYNDRFQGTCESASPSECSSSSISSCSQPQQSQSRIVSEGTRTKRGVNVQFSATVVYHWEKVPWTEEEFVSSYHCQNALCQELVSDVAVIRKMKSALNPKLGRVVLRHARSCEKTKFISPRGIEHLQTEASVELIHNRRKVHTQSVLQEQHRLRGEQRRKVAKRLAKISKIHSGHDQDSAVLRAQLDANEAVLIQKQDAKRELGGGILKRIKSWRRKAHISQMQENK